MRLRDFVKQHRTEIDQAARSITGQPDLRLNDEDREEWVRNDEGLYSWARSEGWPG